MDIDDFVIGTEDGFGLCATAEFDNKEFILSEQFVDGVFGVKEAVDKAALAMEEGGTISARYPMMKTMVAQEAAFPGMLVTGKGSGAIATVKREWGVKRNLRRDKLPLIMDMVLGLGALLYQKRMDNI